MSKGVILYIGFFSLPDKDAAACRVLNNAKIFSLLDYEVIFIDEQVEYPFKNIFDSKRKIKGFTVYSLERPKNIKSFFSKMMSVNSILPILNKIENLKMVIAYNYPAFALNQIRKILKRKVKVCSDCTEWYSGNEYRFPLNFLAKIDSFLRMRIVNKKLDGIICISSYLMEYYKRKNTTILLPPLVDIEDDIWHQKKINFDSRKINLVYAGSPGRHKDLIKPIINIVCNLKYKDSFVLRVVGITKKEYLEQNPDDIKKIDVDNIIFMGRVPHSENIRIVSSSDFLVFIREKNRVSMAGFSTKFVEAITSGTSVITTDTSDMKKYIEKINKGIILKNIEELSGIFLEINEHWERLEDVTLNINPCNIFDYKEYRVIFENWILKMNSKD